MCEKCKSAMRAYQDRIKKHAEKYLAAENHWEAMKQISPKLLSEQGKANLRLAGLKYDREFDSYERAETRNWGLWKQMLEARKYCPDRYKR